MPGLVGVSATLPRERVRLPDRGDPRLPLHLAADHLAGQPASRPPATGATTSPRWTSWPATTTSTPPSCSGRCAASSSTTTPTGWPPRRPVGALVPREFTDLPSGLDPIVRQLALQVTDEEPTRFEKAVALQQWFREDGGFTYDDRRSTSATAPTTWCGSSPQGDGGRTGYCEQFAAAMAVMARDLGIPARVAVGFLDARAGRRRTPTSTAPTTCTPGPSCSSPAPAGSASSRRRPAGPAASPTTPQQAVTVGNDT